MKKILIVVIKFGLWVKIDVGNKKFGQKLLKAEKDGR